MAATLPPSLPLLRHDAVLVPGSTLLLRRLPSAGDPWLGAAARNDGRFGVCFADHDGDTAPLVGTVGVEAHIDDFSSTADGALALRIRARRRFRVRQVVARDSGLLTAVVDWCEPDTDEPLRPEHALLATVLEQILAQADADALASQRDDSAWVGWRLVEWLPLSNDQRQALLQEDDSFVRLDRLLVLLS